MKLLIIDTSSQALYVAAADENKDYIFYDKDLKKQHSQTLLYHTDKLLAEANLTLKDFDCYCCAVGPGSFTGIRIGITTARAFAQALDKPVMAVNSLALMAYNVKENGALIPVRHAVSEKYYAAAYFDGKEIAPADMLEIDELKKLYERLKQQYKGARILSEEQIAGIESDIVPQPPNYCGYCREKYGKGEILADFRGLVPVYAAVSQAERTKQCK